MTVSDEIGVLIYRRATGNISSEEQAVLDNWLNESDENRLFFTEMMSSDTMLKELIEQYQLLTEEEIQNAWQELVDSGRVPGTARVFKFNTNWIRYSIAAALIGMAIITVMLLYGPISTSVKQTPLTETKQIDVKPGESKAILTLSDGRKVVLDSAYSEMLSMQAGVKLQNRNGRLTYIPASNSSEKVVYNTLSTTNGQIYATVLADGSKVWLNSASSLRYPVAFNGKERVVELQHGEALFEVARNKQLPFKVIVKDYEVLATGTSFNIQAFSDETFTRTTLLEGGVKVTPSPSSSGRLPIILKPGQQAESQSDGSLLVHNDVDLEEATAWKNNMFVFNNTSLPALLGQLQRWYNIEATYQGNVRELTFSGQISRYSNISKVLRVLELSGAAHFKLENGRLLVTPK